MQIPPVWPNCVPHRALARITWNPGSNFAKNTSKTRTSRGLRPGHPPRTGLSKNLSTISGKSEVFAISVLPDGTDIHDYDSSMWFETDIPITARKTKYGHLWKGVADKIGTFRKAKRLVTGEYKVFLYAFGNLSSDRGWSKVLKDNLTFLS